MAEAAPRWVVTGPLGAGKSLAAGLLRERGAAVVDGDALGHAVLGEPGVADAVAAAFGAGVLQGGRVARAELGRLVFADPRARERLEAIVHPPLAARMTAALAAAALGPPRPRLAVLEAAVYFWLAPLAGVDLVVAVLADRPTRRARLLAAGRWDAAEVDRRLDAQRHLEPLWSRADVILDNSGDRAALAVALDRLLAARLPA